MKKIKVYSNFNEIEKDEIAFLSKLSVEERLNLFFSLMKLSKKFSRKSLKTDFKKIEIRNDYRFW